VMLEQPSAVEHALTRWLESTFLTA
jgi:hypothetical protein